MKNENNIKNIKSEVIQHGELQPSFYVSTYNEMMDQTAQNVDVIDMIHNQFEELNKISAKRKFLLKEISQYLK